MAKGRVSNGWAFALASFPCWGTVLALIVIQFSGSFTAVFGTDAEVFKLLQKRSLDVDLWVYWMFGTFFIGFIDARQLRRNGVALQGWESALTLLLPPAYLFVRNRAVVKATGKDQPVFGALIATWIAAVGSNAIFTGLISADQLLRIAKDAAILIAWVLVVAALWAVGERLFASLRKRP